MADKGWRREIRFWGSNPDSDLDDEIRFHVEMRAADLVEMGWRPEEARAEALRAFGDMPAVRTECRRLDRQRERHMRVSTWFADLWQDAVLAVRQYRANRAFASAALLTMALGIGATTAIFSVVNAVILRPLPFPESNRIALVFEELNGQLSDVSAGNFVYFRTGSRDIFSELAAVNYANVNLAGGDAPEQVTAGTVSHGFFELFGTRPLYGRTPRADEDAPGREDVVVLSHALWVRKYGADPRIVGRTIRMNNRVVNVIGVMPASFSFLTTGEDLWTPIAFSPERAATYDEHYLTVFGRLRPGVTWDRARERLSALSLDLRKRYPRDDSMLGARVEPYADWLTGDVRGRLFSWLGAVACVLLIACANVANLLLARGAARGRELAVRAALGASRWRIMRQLLVESLVLASAGAALGLLLATWTIRVIVSAGPSGLPRLQQTAIDGAVLAFTVALAIISSLVCGLMPAFRAARTDLQGSLRQGGRLVTVRGGRDRVRSALVAVECALAVTLVVGAGLLLRNALKLQQVDPGFNPRGVLTARVTLSPDGYGSSERVEQAFAQIVQGLAKSPGVVAAGLTSEAPMAPGGNGNGLIPEGRPAEAKYAISSRLRMVTPGYLRTMGIHLARGRDFSETDRRGAPRVMIVSEALAKAAWPGQDPIGKRILCCEGGPQDPRWKTVVGVASDVRSYGLDAAAVPEFYLPIAQLPPEAWNWIQVTMTLAARSNDDPIRLVPAMRESVRAVDASLPLHNIATMEQRIDASLASARFSTALVGALGSIALALAAIGIYGVVAYFVTTRRYEIGVRLALGATPSSVVGLVVRHALGPVTLGLMAGAGGAFIAARALRDQLPAVGPLDPVAFVAGLVVLAGVAVCASVVPARRASRVPPGSVLGGS